MNLSEQFTSESIFHLENRVAPLRLIPLRGARELAEKIDHYLVNWAAGSFFSEDTFIVESECPRFSSGDGKGMIKESIRGDDLYILVDVGNYDCDYKLFGRKNAMSPDDHFQDLKRIIQATSGKAHRLNVIMPILYGGRQHRRNYRESLDCAVALQELQAMGVENIVTFDAHDPRVHNAIPLMGFDNVMPYYQVLKKLFRDFPDIREDRDHLMIVSPDEGAMNRNMYYASVLGVDLGMFYKRRDYSCIVGGRNPIVAHEYLGNSVEGKDIFIADDIISSGESMLDIAYELKKRKTRLSLNSAETAIAYVKPLFRGVQNEQLYLILLDDACRPVQDLRIAEGVPNRVAVDTRKLLRAVARTNSTCGILAHNHPTGLAIPSEADRLTTYHIMEVTGQLGFTIMDHIIIAGEDGCSMLNRGSLPEYRANSGVLQAASR